VTLSDGLVGVVGRSFGCVPPSSGPTLAAGGYPSGASGTRRLPAARPAYVLARASSKDCQLRTAYGGESNCIIKT
jgi:hypothetical protein